MKALKLSATCLFFLIVFLGVSSFASAALLSQAPGTILYVKPGANGTCASWATACDLQTAIFNASAGNQIWVAAGSYKPSTANRSATFQLESGVAIYGGFVGTETSLAQRDWVNNPTTLSGDIGLVNDSVDNSYHVVTASGVDATAILDGFTIKDGNANGSSPDNYGGGMYNSASSPTISNVIFTANRVTEYGGGMYNTASSPSLTNVTFSGNKADGFTSGSTGGGMYNTDSNPLLTNVSFSNNTATHNGGGMFNLNSNPILTGCTFSGNKAEGTNQSTGGGMYNSGSSPTLTDVTFSSNTAYLFGDNGGGGMFNSESNPTLTNVTFSNNSASRGAGMSNKTSNPTLIGGTFSQNSAYIEGGGMYNASGSAPSLSGVTFSGNKVYGYTTSGGGGMYNLNSNPTLTNVTFDSNLAKMDTGSNYCYGGGMFNNASYPILTDVDFVSNKAGSGGGMYNSGSSPLLTNVTFTDNDATSTLSNNGGGGMYNSGGSPVLNNITFSGNTAVRAGGGIYNSGSSPSLRYILLSDNSSVSGGGIYNNGGNPTLQNVAFTNNSADYGGGMQNSGSNTLLMNVAFTGNTATYHGGGLHNANSPTLTNVTFSFNVAGFGGGIFIGDNASSPTLTNVTFLGNAATHSAGSGGGIYNYSPSTTITNGIFWGNTTDQIAPINPTITYSVIQGWTSGGTGNISTNPLLGSLMDNGGFSQTHALGVGSPAIDTGSPTVCPVVDQRGYARPIDGDGVIGARCDMGAYEYNSSLATFTLSVNLVGGGTVTKNPDKAQYIWGEQVILTASDGPDWIFDGWSGDAAGTVNPLRVIIYNHTNITASFWLDAWTLTSSVIPPGTGTVEVVPDQPTYHIGEQVTLTAFPSPGWSFLSWTGDASGSTNPLTITIAKNTSITANFTQDEYSLEVFIEPSDQGSVGISPSKPFYFYGDEVILTASTTLTGWRFTEWSGDASGTDNPLIFTIQGNSSITANFSNQYTLTTSIDPTDSGEVTRDLNPDTYTYGTQVALTATPSTGWTFSGWTGDIVSTDNPLTVTIEGDTSITANFTPIEYTLTVTINPLGSGKVSFVLEQATYHYGDEVKLTAVPGTGYSFGSWSGDVESTDNPLTITIEGDTSITANFTPIEYTLIVAINPLGSGTVTQVQDQATYHYGDKVVLTAAPGTGYSFGSWSGDMESTDNPLTMTIEGDTSITANFAQEENKIYLPLVLR